MIDRSALFVALKVAALALLIAVAPDCSGKQHALSEIREAFDSGNYDETIILCRHALRREYHEGEIYYYYGLALSHLGRDYEAFRQLDEAIRIDPVLAKGIASSLLATATDALNDGNVQRGERRLRAAVTYYPGIELGRYRFAAADAFLREGDHARAAMLYKEAIQEFPDTSCVEDALFHMTTCYASLGLEERCSESLRKLLSDFPSGRFKGKARWRLANLLYDKAEREFSLGNFDAVVEVVGELLTLTENAALVQKSRFLLGEAYEGLGEFRKAYEEYRAVIQQDRGASGRIVERAQGKIAILREAGLF